ncbi:hypothetical protein SODG_000029 [Sodalis praecaptivus]
MSDSKQTMNANKPPPASQPKPSQSYVPKDFSTERMLAEDSAPVKNSDK